MYYLRCHVHDTRGIERTLSQSSDRPHPWREWHYVADVPVPWFCARLHQHVDPGIQIWFQKVEVPVPRSLRTIDGDSQRSEPMLMIVTCTGGYHPCTAGLESGSAVTVLNIFTTTSHTFASRFAEEIGSPGSPGHCDWHCSCLNKRNQSVFYFIFYFGTRPLEYQTTPCTSADQWGDGAT
jgi:hypothetical protein